MINIFRKDDALCKNFLLSLLEENTAECIMEILFECTDKVSQNNVGLLMRYLLCRLKYLEREDLLSGATVKVTEKDSNGNDTDKAIDLPKAVSARFMNVLLYHLKERAARSWSRFEQYLEIIRAFGLNSAEDIEKEIEINGESTIDPTYDAQRVGLEYYLKNNVLENLLDFILQDSSPLKGLNEKRVSMGSSFISVNFTPLVKLITTSMTEHELLKVYPLSDVTKQMIASKEMIGKMMEPMGSSYSSKEVILMCQNDFRLSKKVAKLLIKGINQYQVDKVTKYLKLLKKFLRIDDEHKMARIEWTLGVP